MADVNDPNAPDTVPKPTPDEVLGEDDPGDDVRRRFRYQDGYGVLLLLGAFSGRLPYRSIWCEHHDDFLLEREEGKFDVCQVKTRRPERGPWTLSERALIDAIGKFVRLERRFPGRLHEFSFVSNADHLDSEAADRRHQSPLELHRAAQTCASFAELRTALGALSSQWPRALDGLQAKCECTPEELIGLLRRLKLPSGPGLKSFRAEILVDHLATLPACGAMSQPALKRAFDLLAAQVEDASSITVPDPAKHWACVSGESRTNPILLAKRISIDVVPKALVEARRQDTGGWLPSFVQPMLVPSARRGGAPMVAPFDMATFAVGDSLLIEARYPAPTADFDPEDLPEPRAQAREVLRLVHRRLRDGGAPEVVRFEIEQRDHLDLIGAMRGKWLVRMGSFLLVTSFGLVACDTDEARADLAHAEQLIRQLRDLYSNEPGREWTPADVSARLGGDVSADLRGLTLLFTHGMFDGAYIGPLGFVDRFRIPRRSFLTPDERIQRLHDPDSVRDLRD